MLLSAVSVLLVAQSSSEIPEGLMNNPVQLDMFDVCTTGDTVHINTIFKFLSHTRQYGCIDILHCCNDPCL